MKFASQTATTLSPAEKLKSMATQLQNQQLDAYYIPPEDEHLNEYLPDNKKRIEWLTGFTGESAPMFATVQKFHLYVDGRFHIQIDSEADPSVVNVTKLGPDDSGDILAMAEVKQLAAQKPAGAFRIGYDPFIVSPQRLARLQKQLDSVTWVPVSGNLVDPTWTGRPPSVSEPVYSVSPQVIGKSVKEKLADTRQKMANFGAQILPLTRLDDIAWLYNIRGKDIPFNPVAESYAIVTPQEAYWFVPLSKVPSDIQSQLQQEGVTLKSYDDYQATLTQLVSAQPKPVVLVDKDSMTEGTLDIIRQHAGIVEKDNPVTLQKAVKNPTEIQGMLGANFKASRAIIRHLFAMETAFAQGKTLSEVDVRDDLEVKYKQESNFIDLSFPTIPGIGTNSAIIHYSHADPGNTAKPEDWYLIDSGCQYLGGTTDTTRTTVFGTPRADQIQRYTAVLKAHIACASYGFPEGTKGIQLDAVTRYPMHQEGLDFAHGTGHGVGAFLNVHEGPNRISRACQVAFLPGMITSIEPGYYEENWGGIRLENLYYVAQDSSKAKFLGKGWLKFEPLTFVPFEKKLIDFDALTKAEKSWLTQYYQQVWDKLSPTLDADEQAWLKNQVTLPA